MIDSSDLFDWDAGNLQHVILDYPERRNTKTEIESIFTSPHFVAEFDREDPKTGELRYYTLGIGTEGRVKYVVFVVRNNKIRPITCYIADRKQQRKYYERVNHATRNAGPAGEPGASGSTQELNLPSGS